MVLTIDYTPSLEVLKRLDWKPAIGMGLAELTLFCSRTRAEADLHSEGVTTVQRITIEMVSDINLIHANRAGFRDCALLC